MELIVSASEADRRIHGFIGCPHENVDCRHRQLDESTAVAGLAVAICKSVSNYAMISRDRTHFESPSCCFQGHGIPPEYHLVVRWVCRRPPTLADRLILRAGDTQGTLYVIIIRPVQGMRVRAGPGRRNRPGIAKDEGRVILLC